MPTERRDRQAEPSALALLPALGALERHPGAVNRPPLCHLPLDEYERATREFFSQAVDAVARAGNPILGQVQREQVEVLAPSVNTMDSGEIVRLEPLLSSAFVSFSVSNAIRGDFSNAIVAIAETAEQFVASVIPSVFGHISDICDATGNVISGKDRPIEDVILEALETISISFDEDGNPSLPSLVVSPDAYAKMGNPPEGHEARTNELIARRRNEWLARRRTRRLPRHSR
jgi:hypothetical protein